MISLTNHDSQWGRSEVVIIYPELWLKPLHFSHWNWGPSPRLRSGTRVSGGDGTHLLTELPPGQVSLRDTCHIDMYICIYTIIQYIYMYTCVYIYIYHITYIIIYRYDIFIYVLVNWDGPRIGSRKTSAEETQIQYVPPGFGMGMEW